MSGWREREKVVLLCTHLVYIPENIPTPVYHQDNKKAHKGNKRPTPREGAHLPASHWACAQLTASALCWRHRFICHLSSARRVRAVVDYVRIQCSDYLPCCGGRSCQHVARIRAEVRQTAAPPSTASTPPNPTNHESFFGSRFGNTQMFYFQKKKHSGFQSQLRPEEFGGWRVRLRMSTLETFEDVMDGLWSGSRDYNSVQQCTVHFTDTTNTLLMLFREADDIQSFIVLENQNVQPCSGHFFSESGKQTNVIISTFYVIYTYLLNWVQNLLCDSTCLCIYNM